MDIFSSPDAFVSHPRTTSLTTRHDRTIATVATISQKKDSYTSALVELTSGTPVTLTRSLKGEGLMEIGEHGEVYFASGRDDERADGDSNALWMLPPAGEARVVLRTPGSIDSVTATGGKLFVVVNTYPAKSLEESAKLEADRKERGVSAILHESFPVRYWDHDLGPTYPQLFVADAPSVNNFEALQPPAPEPADKPASPESDSTLPESEITLTPIPVPPGRLGEISVAPDAATVLVTIETLADRSTEEVTSVYAVDVATGAVTDVAIAPRSRADVPDTSVYSVGPFSPDSARAVIGVEAGNRDGVPLRNTVELWDRESGNRTPLIPDFADWTTSFAWVTDDTLAFTADRLGRASIYLVDVAENSAKLLTDDDFAYSNIGARDGQLYALRSAITEPGRPVAVGLDGTVTELAALTEPVTWPGTISEVTTTAADGTALRAWLCLPESDAPAPLLVFVHGGPWGSWNDWTWRWNPGLFVAQGYAVLLPDPAISTGYGQHMIDRGNDAIGDAPYTDILALIDATEARADVDGTNTALLGGSYGGYMANWMAGHTGDRFSCIVSHASLWDVDFMAKTTDNGSWYEWMMPSQAERYSPHLFAEQIEVPMLVIHGDKDYRVPVSQSHALWQALNRVSKVRGHKFLYFPDENHWILKPSNSRVWYETVLAFVNEHVLGEGWKRPELLG